MLLLEILYPALAIGNTYTTT